MAPVSNITDVAAKAMIWLGEIGDFDITADIEVLNRVDKFAPA